MKMYSNSIWRKLELLCLLSLLLLAASLECNAQEKPAANAERDSIIIAAREIIGKQKYCALITIDSTGRATCENHESIPAGRRYDSLDCHQQPEPKGAGNQK